jgi:hypothetical protein
MPFEETDKKIIEAAENHHPSYDEGAWEKMNKLLNKHMPVKEKKKRRAAFLLLLFLIAGGGATYLSLNNSDAGKKIVLTKTEQPANQQPVISKSTHNPTENIEIIKPTGTELSENEKKGNEVKATPVISFPAVNTPTENKTKRNQPAASPVKRRKDKDLTTDLPVTQNPASTVIQHSIFNPDPSINKSVDPSNVNPETVSGNISKILPTQKEGATDAVKPQPTDQEKPPTPDPTVAKKSSKAKKGKGNGLFISLSAGPDVGAISISRIGKLKAAYGVGLGYAFNNRISLQTGFYSARKIYSAGPNDYNPPSWWWAYYPSLEKVEADCKVYEIPLLVNYNFSVNKKRNWFGTFGLSSYIMKKEDYNYYYKTATGQPTTRNWVYNNENKHYFSVITLAGGYERKITNKFSVSLSPYIKLPWQGVGFGKVKLNSTGALLSANFKPFAK